MNANKYHTKTIHTKLHRQTQNKIKRWGRRLKGLKHLHEPIKFKRMKFSKV